LEFVHQEAVTWNGPSLRTRFQLWRLTANNAAEKISGKPLRLRAFIF
jgi:hypothetical protein